jgi:DUF1365 family protein
MMRSGLYVGRLRHRRFLPTPHAFRYGLFMVYLDLAELDAAFRGRWLWSMGRRNLAWFRRADYLGAPEIPLDQAVRDLAERRTGRRPAGPIRMLTHLRYFGYCFNPVTFYYCFDADGQRVDAIVAEITNTPWNERHSYVLTEDLSPAPAHEKSKLAPDRFRRYRFPKDFHVSPFFPLDIDYDWRFSAPGESLNVHMNLTRHGAKVFDATLELKRREMTGANLALALLRFPGMTAKVAFGIYWHATLLKLKRIPFFDHPGHAGESSP